MQLTLITRHRNTQKNGTKFSYNGAKRHETTFLSRVRNLVMSVNAHGSLVADMPWQDSDCGERIPASQFSCRLTKRTD